MEKILFLITHSEVGGAQKNVLFSAQKLKKEGFDVMVGTGTEGPMVESLKKIGIPVIVFNNLKRSFNPFSSFAFCWQLRQFVKKEKIQTINFNSSNTVVGILALLFLKNKPKTIFTVHGWSYLSPGFKKSRIIKFIFWLAMKKLLFFVDEVVFVCNYDMELAKKLWLIKENQGKVIYNQIEKIDFLNREEARKELKVPENKIIIGTITRLEYAKNNEMLIEAVSKLRSDKIICLIIGSGPEENNLKFKIENLKLENKVFLLGNVPDASKYLKAFDVFVMTSRYEGMPYALLEAISAGLPIIATRVGGIPEVLKDKGTLIKSGSVEELIKEIANLLS
jgi:glycosyltransferase involved in cell wall biosynthesis